MSDRDQDDELAAQEYDLELRHGRPERLNPLVDGVYAIIMTLLVLELKVPEGLSPAEAVAHLRELTPRFVAFFVSFGVAAASWAYTHAVSPLFVRSNTTHVAMTLLTLMFAALIPFCASVLGSLPNDALGPQAYALVIVAVTACGGLDLALGRRDLMPRHVPRRLIHTITILTFLAAAYMVFVGLVVAPWSPRIALILIVLHFVGHWILLAAFSRPILRAVRGG